MAVDLANSNIFVEREQRHGLIYIETADKSTLKKIRDITFVNAKDILGIVYNSKSKDTSLKWKRKRGNSKVTGKASTNSLINLSESGVLTPEWIDMHSKKQAQETETVSQNQHSN